MKISQIMRKTGILLLAGILFLSMGTMNLKAAENVYSIEPRTYMLEDCNAALVISGNTASIYAYVSGDNTTKYTSVVATLQKKVNGEWINVESWKGTCDGVYAYVDTTYTVSRGTYRVSATVQAINGKYFDTQTVVSATSTY